MKSKILLKILMPFFLLFASNVLIAQITTSTTTLTGLTTTYGTASSNNTFDVSGASLTTDININAPSGFEVSTSPGSGFATSITLTQIAGSVALTPIYVRIAASSNVAGSPYSGNISLSTTGHPTIDVAIANSTVSAKGLTISGLTANNKVYNATNTATLAGTAALVGVETGDAGNVTLAGSPSSTFADALVGTAKAVTVTGYSITGTAAGNYSVYAQSVITASITTNM